MNNANITFRLPGELKKLLKNVCTERDIRMNALLIEMIEYYQAGHK
jgi:hypothetical protein